MNQFVKILEVSLKLCLLFTTISLLQQWPEVYMQEVPENSSAPFLTIEQGPLQGKYLNSQQGRNFSAFTAIPYGKPPVGALRFEAPQPAEPWGGILDGTKSHAICPQPESFARSPPTGNEDCLYLNVYTPHTQFPVSNTDALPVMVFIHGGSFVSGSANPTKYDPSILLDKDIVLVVPNYRLGPIGFFSTGDDVVPGNNGLKDQNLAIKWAKKNIPSFGGDADRIVLMGQSAGGVSAHLHMLSPMSKDLIKGVIAESSTALSGWSPNDKVQRNSKTLARALNCTTESSSEMVECLRNLSVSEIIGTRDMFFEWQEQPSSSFKAVIENTSKEAFLPEHPIDIIKSGKAANIPLLTGININEGGLKAAIVFRSAQRLREFNEDFNRLAALTLGYDDTASDVDYVSQEVRRFYLGDGEIDNSSRADVAKMHTDKLFLLPVNDAVRLHLAYIKQPVYYYVFGYRSSISHSDVSVDPHYNYGVVHNDELLYFFPPLKKSFPNYIPSDEDKNIRELLTTFWTNFARTGNPNPTVNTSISATWEPIRSENIEYLFIKNDTGVEMAEKVHWEQEEFWQNLPINSYSCKMC